MIHAVHWTDHQGAEHVAFCDDAATAEIVKNALRGDGRMCASAPTVEMVGEEEVES